MQCTVHTEATLEMIVLAGAHIYGFKPTLLTLLAAQQLTRSQATATDLTVGQMI